MKDDLAHITARREELEALIAGRKEEPVLLHPGMAAHYRNQVATLAQTLNRDENRTEAADLLRSLVERIELAPNEQGRLEIDLHGDLAGILMLAQNAKTARVMRAVLCIWLRGQDLNL
ncbi:hypothetical protein [Mesorhizobium sp.]|uniref:hypothetical protein n=1 Tax=Mesorhizobium sp. TaxID=1871066 RepID=UPI000FE623E5|nr:hypothetical protein [Mesorhizobium sp.]RWQ04097.1 MAG: hypothetical protein EOR89_08380 [Mesorhizobium sp.]RWQ52149.1 MAG: hypothetical protein EOS82_11430 [Mesorhizobium sp.]